MLRKQTCSKELRKHKCTTAGVLTSLGLTAGCVTAIVLGRKYLIGECDSTADEVKTYFDAFLNITFMLQNLTTTLSTSFPNHFPASANVSIPSFGVIPISTTLDVSFPQSTSVTIGPITDSVRNLMTQLFGQASVNFLQSYPDSAKQTCETDASYAVIVIGTLVWLLSLLLTAMIFGFGSRLYSQDKHIKRIERQLEEWQKKFPSLETPSEADIQAPIPGRTIEI
jgi:hypothetical protein